MHGTEHGAQRTLVHHRIPIMQTLKNCVKVHARSNLAVRIKACTQAMMIALSDQLDVPVSLTGNSRPMAVNQQH
jgi:hypothetical protein